MNQLKKRLGVIGLIFLMTSCCGEKKSVRNNRIIGKVVAITIEHSTEKNELCENTRLVFQLEFRNTSNDMLVINNCFTRNQLCQHPVIRSTVKLKTDSTFIEPLFWDEFPHPICYDMFFLSDKTIKIPSNAKTKINCTLLTTIYGASLNQILDIYEPLFESSFTIETNRLQKKMLFLKDPNMDLILKLNGEIVTRSDTAKMNTVSKIYSVLG